MWTRRLEIWLTKLLKKSNLHRTKRKQRSKWRKILNTGRNGKLASGVDQSIFFFKIYWRINAKTTLHILWTNIHIEKRMPSSRVPFVHDKTSSLLQWVTHWGRMLRITFLLKQGGLFSNCAIRTSLLITWRLREKKGGKPFGVSGKTSNLPAPSACWGSFTLGARDWLV